ncbi:MAG TPA: mismatch-specific DNA-glycosylase [Egibacteraceae bacterium]|nr:mismatch-specific DNA-glycosylase [Egibacteraceae bacterium]
MRFSKEELQAQYGRTVPDLIGPDCRLLFVGINPGLWTAAVQTHFARPGNRFWPALHAAGITERQIDARTGFTSDDKDYLVRRGIGITNLVPRATARADELTHAELVEGGDRLRRLVGVVKPKVVAVVGLTAYRVAFGIPKAEIGRQPESLEGAEVWAVPNPSGLNAHYKPPELAEWYRRVAAAAGILRESTR